MLALLKFLHPVNVQIDSRFISELNYTSALMFVLHSHGWHIEAESFED